MSIDMMKYWTKVFKKPYPDGWKDKPNKTTPIRGKVMDAYDSAMDEIDSRVLSLGESVVDHDFRIEQNEGRFSIVFKEIEKENGLIAELADTKITKIYAGNNGATVLTDSGNGKIQDMILYGKSEQKQYSGKNLLNFTIATTTLNGVTCTNNGDGTYTLNGTASSVTSFIFYSTLQPGKYKAVGCPSNGNLSTYSIQNIKTNTGGEILAEDSGDGATFELSEETIVCSYIRIASGYSCNNLVFKPMLTTDTSATYDDFEPYVGGIPSPNPDYPQEIKSVVNPVITLSDGENSQTVTLPFTLNAIPVSDAGNITIDGQQYIADYVDVERKKLVRCIGFFNGNVFSYDEPTKKRWRYDYDNAKIKTDTSKIYSLCNKYPYATNDGNNTYRTGSSKYSKSFLIYADADADLSDVVIYTALEVPTETDLTDEQVNALKALSTYYPTTNVAVTSDELDGYVTFDYPLCFESAAEYAVGSLQFAFESGLPKSTFRIYGSDSKESMYDIRIVVFDSNGVAKQLTQFSLYAYGGKSVGNGTVNTSYGVIRQNGSGYVQLETKADYNWKVWISGKGWRVEKV